MKSSKLCVIQMTICYPYRNKSSHILHSSLISYWLLLFFIFLPMHNLPENIRNLVGFSTTEF